MMSSPEVAGLLYKRRGGFGKMMPNAWQFRFFAITKDGVLLYFDTESFDADFDINKARGRLDLRSIPYEYSTEPIEGAPTSYSIQIGTPNEEKWKMCAETKEDQTRWCKTLEKFMLEKSVRSKVSANATDAGNVPPSSPGSSNRDNELKSVTSAPSSPTTTDTKTFRERAASPVPVRDSPAAATTAAAAAPVAPVTNKEFTSSKPVKSVEPVAPVVASPAPTPSPAGGHSAKTRHHKKGGLKLASKKNFIDQESIEWYLVIVIVNISFLGVWRSKSTLLTLLYVLISNVVVGYTLKLRYDRVQKALAAQAKTATTTTTSTQEMSPVAAGKSSSEVSVQETAVAVKAGSTEEEEETDSALPSIKTGVSGKPIPGSTYRQSFSEPKLAPAHTWSAADHRQFQVRVGPEYNRYKKKAASAAPIYEVFAVDMFCAKTRVDHAASRFELPDTSHINTNNPHVPPIFVVQIQIPSEPPQSFFSNSEDGPGWAVVMYFRITEDACNQLKDLATASPAVKLFAEWCEKAPVDPAWRGRFKVINSCTNLDELGFPSLIVSYNAKPVLIRRTGTIFRGSNYMEMDIHVHKFANVAKQSIYLISSRCAQMFMQIGFVIEGRDDKELPETLFACVAVNRPQEDQADFIFDE